MASSNAAPVIAIVAGEASGDILGAGLMRALREYYPHAQFMGVCGPLMEAEGGKTVFPMEALSVMGITEVLPKLPELMRLRRELVEAILAAKPAVCITIDSPDFTLGVAQRLRRAGVRTVHYVSPSVWAWRKGRLKTIKAGVDHMLALLPFEPEIYLEAQIPATFVGHPLADDIPMTVDQEQARRALGLSTTGRVLAVLPGSRGGEVRRLLPPFLQAVALLREHYPELEVVIPAANAMRKQEIEAGIKAAGLSQLTVIEGQSRTAMAAADVLLMASGTATLEGALLKKPMVVGYRLGAFTYWLLSLLVKVDYVALPNLLCNEPLIPEFMQLQLTPEHLCAAVMNWFENPARVSALEQRFTSLHEQLRQDASATAATVVRQLIEVRP